MIDKKKRVPVGLGNLGNITYDISSHITSNNNTSKNNYNSSSNQ
jgi:hypothetical protein